MASPTITGTLTDLAGQLMAAKDAGLEPEYSTSLALPVDVSKNYLMTVSFNDIVIDIPDWL